MFHGTRCAWRRAGVAVLALACAAGVVSQAVGAPDPRPAALRAYVRDLERFGFSGQILIEEHGRTLLDAAVGFADRDAGTPVTAATRFTIASLTKPFTALAVMALAGDGRLGLADTIGRFLPGAPRDKAGITVAQLLGHTSGLPRDALRARDSLARDDAVAHILAAPMGGAPGEGFRYSNAGYELLAAIVERVSGEPYARFVARRVFDPAGMREAGFVDAPNGAGVPIASGHLDGTPIGGPLDRQPGWKSTGSGSIVATAGDLARWHRALRTGAIVPDSVVARMMRPGAPTGDGGFYGLGWFVQWPGTDSTLVFHGGDAQGFHSDLRWYTREDELIVLLANQDVFDIDGGAVAKRLIVRDLRRILLRRRAPFVPPTAATTAAERRTLAGRYAGPDGSAYTLTDSGGVLRLAAAGSAAIAPLLPGVPAADSLQRAYDARVAALVRAAAARDTAAAGADRADRDFGAPFLAGQFADWSARYGAFESVEMIGSVPFPWDPGAWRTAVRLHFARGAPDVYFGFEQGAMNDVTSESGFVRPISLPVAKLAAGTYAALDLIRGELIPLSFERDPGGRAYALRVGDASPAPRIDAR